MGWRVWPLMTNSGRQRRQHTQDADADPDQKLGPFASFRSSNRSNVVNGEQHGQRIDAAVEQRVSKASFVNVGYTPLFNSADYQN